MVRAGGGSRLFLGHEEPAVPEQDQLLKKRAGILTGQSSPRQHSIAVSALDVLVNDEAYKTMARQLSDKIVSVFLHLECPCLDRKTCHCL